MLQRATHWGLWTLVALGALGGCVGLLRPTSAAPAAEPTNSPAQLPVPPQVPGFAELAVRSWIEPGEHDVALESYFVGGSETANRGTPPALEVGTTSVVAVDSVRDDYWAVTVAAEVRELDDAGAVVSTGTWFVEIGMVEVDGALAAIGTPALVPAPSVATDLRLAGPEPRARLAGDPVADAIEGLLTALLTGDGDLTRYLAPDTELAPISPPPFTVVTIERLASSETSAGGEIVRVLASAVTAGGNEQLLGYELVLVERAGRWEATSLTGAPTLEATPPSRPTDTEAGDTDAVGPGGDPSTPGSTSTTFPPPVASPGA